MRLKRRKPCKLSDVDDLQIRQLERLANTWTTVCSSCPSVSKLSDVDDLQIRQLERLANTWTTATNSCPSAMDNARMLKALADKLKSRNGD